jgi:hypothetical protein
VHFQENSYFLLKTVDCLKCESEVHQNEFASSDTQGDGHYHLIVSQHIQILTKAVLLDILLSLIAYVALIKEVA